jgi:hypothetical protein
MRSASTLREGRVVAKQRAGFYRAIKSWSTADLQASAIRYRMEALANRDAAKFYAIRVRVLTREIRARMAGRVIRIVR